jgi:hypothetical protein
MSSQLYEEFARHLQDQAQHVDTWLREALAPFGLDETCGEEIGRRCRMLHTKTMPLEGPWVDEYRLEVDGTAACAPLRIETKIIGLQESP